MERAPGVVLPSLAPFDAIEVRFYGSRCLSFQLSSSARNKFKPEKAKDRRVSGLSLLPG
jgi:hypothetical protein